MSDIQTGGPAFPLHSEIRPNLDKEWCGMTLRDYFAAKVIGHLVISENRQDFDIYEDASFAYTVADAMLKARAS